MFQEQTSSRLVPFLEPGPSDHGPSTDGPPAGRPRGFIPAEPPRAEAPLPTFLKGCSALVPDGEYFLPCALSYLPCNSRLVEGVGTSQERLWTDANP